MRTTSAIGILLFLTIGVLAQSGPEQPYTVAYASFGPLNSAVYIADADGSHERMLVAGPMLDMNPSFSPDGRSILFTSRRNGSADVYRVQPDGSRLERLTDHPAFDDQAVLSPDGRTVAFVSSRTGQADVWLLDVVSRRLRNLTNHPGGDYRPAWSPDGQWIAFTSDRESAGSQASTPTSIAGFSPPQITELYAVKADGSALRRLTDSDGSVGSAAWSPDGRQLVFYEASPVDWRAMGTDFMGGPSMATSQIVSLDVATGARQVLTSGPGRKYLPKWTGGTVAYVRGDVAEKRGVRQRVNYVSYGIDFVDGRTALRGVYSNVSWSPDGRRMVFHRAIEGDWPPVTRAFSRDRQFAVTRTGIYPSYSPDGRRLMSNTAFAGQFRNTIVMMNPDGTDRRVVFDDPERKRARARVVADWRPHRLRTRRLLRRRSRRLVCAPGRDGRRRFRTSYGDERGRQLRISELGARRQASRHARRPPWIQESRHPRRKQRRNDAPDDPRTTVRQLPRLVAERRSDPLRQRSRRRLGALHHRSRR